MKEIKRIDVLNRPDIYSNAVSSYLKVLLHAFSIKPINVRLERGVNSYTDGERIVIGLDCPLSDGLSDSDYIKSIFGYIYHEFGHILYTPFIKALKAVDAIEKGNLYPYNMTMIRQF